jgi:Na+:H+ antiporter, NhaA family
MTALLQPLPFGILTGLLLGKFVGVFGFSWLLIKSGNAKLPADSESMHLAGVAVLCGIGFTMSLFIGSLAFETAEYLTSVRLGVVLGSTLSAACGFALLRLGSKADRIERASGTSGTVP